MYMFPQTLEGKRNQTQLPVFTPYSTQRPSQTMDITHTCSTTQHVSMFILSREPGKLLFLVRSEHRYIETKQETVTSRTAITTKSKRHYFSSTKSILFQPIKVLCSQCPRENKNPLRILLYFT